MTTRGRVTQVKMGDLGVSTHLFALQSSVASGTDSTALALEQWSGGYGDPSGGQWSGVQRVQ